LDPLIKSQLLYQLSYAPLDAAVGRFQGESPGHACAQPRRRYGYHASLGKSMGF
jgi:hypothetical protein